MKTIILSILLSVVVVSCATDNTSDHKEKTLTGSSYVLPEVKTSKVKKGMFHHEILANGLVVCSNYVDLYFNSEEIISNVNTQNGASVKKGDILAVLDNNISSVNIEQAKIALEQAELNLKDALIGQGYDPMDMGEVPSEIMNLLELRSGVKSARTSLKIAEKEDKDRVLIAPFNGIVANVTQIQGNKANTSMAFCRILSCEAMEVEFKVIETELPLININDNVDISQLNGGSIQKAKIREINPIIDEDGQITVKALPLHPGKLIVGQHVRVAIKKNVEESIVVPKNAVVMRDHRPVVFTLSSDSSVQWNYVEILYENLTEYAISGVSEGLEIISSGNSNLSHGSKVKKIN